MPLTIKFLATTVIGSCQANDNKLLTMSINYNSCSLENIIAKFIIFIEK